MVLILIVKWSITDLFVHVKRDLKEIPSLVAVQNQVQSGCRISYFKRHLVYKNIFIIVISSCFCYIIKTQFCLALCQMSL